MNRGKEQFRTFRGYSLSEADGLTPGMEDYLEMLYRLSSGKTYVRLVDLAARLSVQPPSASRMMQRLSEQGLVQYERYGMIHLTEAGKKLGASLLERHHLLEQFLKLLGVKQNILKDTERIEHIISKELVHKIKWFVLYATQHPEWLDTFEKWVSTQQTASAGKAPGLE
ncbi:MAG TPA: helix-turn-helix domain-containing protein [Firmicutes bacterium]|nr:helix-turn-helix domain-containing protein [Candidatus Fermentithermobacillaceae bacterium]